MSWTSVASKQGCWRRPSNALFARVQTSMTNRNLACARSMPNSHRYCKNSTRTCWTRPIISNCHDCECWAITLQRPSINPFLEYSPNREMRKAMFDGYAMRGDNDNDSDNKAVLARMVQLRAERSALMGYKNHAEFVLSDNMAETPENAYSLLNQIWEPAIRVAKQERADLQAMMQTDGIDDRIRGWDWRYYTAKVQKAKYDIDEDSLRPYFEVTAFSHYQPSSSACNLNVATTCQHGTPTNRCLRSRKPTDHTWPSCTWTFSRVNPSKAAHG